MRQAGFSLIEVLAASMISVLLAGVAYATFKLSNDQLEDGALGLRASQYATVALDQVSSTARSAYVVKKHGDPATALTAPFADPAYAALDTLVFCNRTGDTLGGYAADGNYLREMVGGGPGWHFVPFRIGVDTVRIFPATSSFGILPNRRGVEIRLHFYLAKDGDTAKLPVHRAQFLCRNTEL
jgi:prepilin-type N-terminal cleavage/methylation domain-containing protein